MRENETTMNQRLTPIQWLICAIAAIGPPDVNTMASWPGGSASTTRASACRQRVRKACQLSG